MGTRADGKGSHIALKYKEQELVESYYHWHHEGKRHIKEKASSLKILNYSYYSTSIHECIKHLTLCQTKL